MTETASVFPPPDPPDYAWGGDGSEENEPIRAHVEAALVHNDQPYPPPLDALLQIGDRRAVRDTDPVVALGFTQEHVPDLVRMTRDRALNTAMSDTSEVWAPLYALDALLNLDITEVIPDLLPLFDLEHDYYPDALVELLGKAGAPAIEPLRGYIEDESRWGNGRASVSTALAEVAVQHPEQRDRVIQILSDLIDRNGPEHETLNGMVLADLLELEAVEALPVIRRAFERDAIEEMVTGDWETVQRELDIDPDPSDPLVAHSKARWDTARAEMSAQLGEIQGLLDQLKASERATPVAAPVKRTSSKESAASKAKRKRKTEKASRKANRKKHR